MLPVKGALRSGEVIPVLMPAIEPCLGRAGPMSNMLLTGAAGLAVRIGSGAPLVELPKFAGLPSRRFITSRRSSSIADSSDIV